MSVEIYTDGAASAKMGVGGWAAVMFIDGVQIDAIFGGVKGATNNQMELMGVIHAMKLIPMLPRIACKNCGVTEFTPTGDEYAGVHGGPMISIQFKDLLGCDLMVNPGKGPTCKDYDKWVTRVPMYQNVVIYSDSEYCVKGASHWIEMWKTNGWKTKAKQPVANQELWQHVDALKKALQPEFKWVKGHAGNHGNEIADGLAQQAALLTKDKAQNSWSEKIKL